MQALYIPLCYGFSEIAALLTNLSQVFCPSSEECVATSARCHFAYGDIGDSLYVRRNTLPTAFSCGAHPVGTKAEEGFFPFRWQARRARDVRCKRVVRHRQPLLFAKRRHTACSTDLGTHSTSLPCARMSGIEPAECQYRFLSPFLSRSAVPRITGGYFFGKKQVKYFQTQKGGIP